MVSFAPAPGEKVILDEDCAEEKLKSGILVLTDRRLVFQKTQGRMATLSKKEGEVVLDIPLGKITGVKAEGFLVKKVVVVSGDQTYKFGVYNNGKWERQIKQLIGAS
ncbi:MAG TPA: PH domain-containing protein [Nitrososphaera sp.]|nr:PH domain-containing protein [Nitrososphaera sp.]